MNRRELLSALLLAPLAKLFRRKEMEYPFHGSYTTPPWVDDYIDGPIQSWTEDECAAFQRSIRDFCWTDHSGNGRHFLPGRVHRGPYEKG